jgi:Uncharacterized conserved protein
MVTLKDIKQNSAIMAMIKAGNRHLEALGYTDHGPRHVSYVSKTAKQVLKELGYSPREMELAAIAGWVHDIGNTINRHNHGATGAVMLFSILREAGLDMADVMEIITAVGNHEEESGYVSSAVSAALVIGDKSDAHCTRVRHGKPVETDVHDRVNFAIRQNGIEVDRKNRIIRHALVMDESSSILEYFQIYMPRIVMCEQAAAYLNCTFDLCINDTHVNNRVQQKAR